MPLLGGLEYLHAPLHDYEFRLKRRELFAVRLLPVFGKRLGALRRRPSDAVELSA